MTLPNFLIIGAAKAGTTSLYDYLKQHPQIYMSSVKEPKFFAVEGEVLDFRGPGDLDATGPKRGVVTELNAYQELFKDVSNEIAIGEASPWYLYIPKASSRIKHYIPDAKLIAILRNPVDRAYSNFLHITRFGREPLTDFAEALQAEEERIRARWEPHWHYKQMGFYYVQLKRYFDLFDRDRIKIYLYENFSANPIGIVQDVFQFLEVDATFIPDISRKGRVAKPVPKNEALDKFLNRPHPLKSLLKPLLPNSFRQPFANNLRKQNLTKPQCPLKVRQQLIEEYREDILKLQDLIERDLSNWLKS
jgi:hypothetical protein